MKYLVAIDVETPAGALLMSLKGKIGGASSTMDVAGKSHPVIFASQMDWSKLPAFVGMTQIQNPGAPDPMPRELVVPSAAVAVLAETAPAGTQPPSAQQSPASSLH